MLTPDLGVQNPTELNLYSEESPTCTHSTIILYSNRNSPGTGEAIVNNFLKITAPLWPESRKIDYIYIIIKKQTTMAQFKLKQYMFTFEGGGWNTVWAKTKAGAIKAAMLEYKDSDSLNPRKESFHVATEAGLQSAMSLFY